MTHNGDFSEICITLNTQDFSEIFVSEIMDLTCEAVELLDCNIIIRTNKDEKFIASLLSHLQDFCKYLSNINQKNITFFHTITKKQNKDWIEIYRSNVKPIKCGRFYIYPPWEKPHKDSSDIVNIVLEPSLAFGTGHHATTFMCIQALENLHQKSALNDKILLDFGCGSGILALCANKMGAKVDLCDIDELAIDESKKNFNNNNAKISHIWQGGIDNKAGIVKNEHKDKYDIIVANIIASTLIEQKVYLESALKCGGNLILSGILDIYKDDVLSHFVDFEALEVKQSDEWICIVLQKHKF